MSETKPDSSQVASSWDAYWQGTGDIEAFSSGGVSHPAILAFWDSFFESVKQDFNSPTLLDIASGNGAVIERALHVFEEAPLEISCVDVSGSAIRNIKKRFTHVHGIVGDARSISLDSGSFDVVTSQFGVEYAGLDAIDEAARLLATGGRLALLLHNEAGSIHHECQVNLDAISRLQESGFVSLALDMFRAGFDAVQGADRAPYDEAARLLAPAVATAEAIMNQHGEHVADDTISRLYGDVGRIHSDIQQYDPVEVTRWLEKMNEELVSYAGRMASMCSAAIDQTSFERICASLTDLDCFMDQVGPLTVPGDNLPLAWVILAGK